MEIFGCATAIQKSSTVRIFDEEIRVSDVVSEFGDFVEASIRFYFRRELACFPAGLDTSHDGFECRKLSAVEQPEELRVHHVVVERLDDRLELSFDLVVVRVLLALKIVDECVGRVTGELAELGLRNLESASGVLG